MSDGILNKHDMVSNVLSLLDGLTVTGQKNVVLLSTAFQMLTALQKGLKDEDKAKNKIIESLKEQLKRINEPEPGGDVVGGEHYEFDFTKDGADDD